MEKSKNLKEVVIKIEGKDWNDALDKAFKKVVLPDFVSPNTTTLKR